MNDFIKNMSNDELLKQIVLLERLLDVSDFAESVLVDYGMSTLEELRTECIKRFVELVKLPKQ